MFQEFDQPLVVNRIEETFYIRIQYPVHPFARDPDTQRIKRIVLTQTGPEAIAESKEILLVDAVQYLCHRLLDNFILQRCNP